MTRNVVVIAVSLLVACVDESGPPLVVSDVVIKRPIPGATVSAGYLELKNTSGQPITITGIASPQFESVEIHETIIADGIAGMRPVAQLSIAPGLSVRLEPGGKHLMLKQADSEAETVTLQLYSGSEMIISLDAKFASPSN